MRAPVADFAVAGVPAPVPIVLQIVPIYRNVRRRPEPKVVIDGRRRRQRRRALADSLSGKEPTDANGFDFAKFLRFMEKRLRLGVMFRVGSHLRPDLNDLPVLLRGFDELFPLPEVQTNRFFEVNVFSGLHRPNRCEDVPMVASRNNHGVDVGIVEDGSHIGAAILRGRRPLAKVGEANGIGVAKRDDFGVRNIGEEGRQKGAAPPATDESDSELILRTFGENGWRGKRGRRKRENARRAGGEKTTAAKLLHGRDLRRRRFAAPKNESKRTGKQTRFPQGR